MAGSNEDVWATCQSKIEEMRLHLEMFPNCDEELQVPVLKMMQHSLVRLHDLHRRLGFLEKEQNFLKWRILELRLKKWKIRLNDIMYGIPHILTNGVYEINATDIENLRSLILVKDTEMGKIFHLQSQIVQQIRESERELKEFTVTSIDLTEERASVIWMLLVDEFDSLNGPFSSRTVPVPL